MGDEADDILRSFGLSEPDSKKYDVVLAKFEAHFIKRRNVIFKRVKFNMHKQEEGRRRACRRLHHCTLWARRTLWIQQFARRDGQRLDSRRHP